MDSLHIAHLLQFHEVSECAICFTCVLFNHYVIHSFSHTWKETYSPLQQYWNSRANSFVNAVHWRHLGFRSKYGYEKRVQTFNLLFDLSIYECFWNHSGTKRERGLSRDIYLEDSSEMFGTEEMYDLPFGITSRLSSQSWVRYIPFCPWRGHRSSEDHEKSQNQENEHSTTALWGFIFYLNHILVYHNFFWVMVNNEYHLNIITLNTKMLYIILITVFIYYYIKLINVYMFSVLHYMLLNYLLCVKCLNCLCELDW